MEQEVCLIVDPVGLCLRDEAGHLIPEDRWIDLPWGTGGRYLRYRIDERPVSPHALSEQAVEVVLTLDNGGGFMSGRTHQVDFQSESGIVIGRLGLKIEYRQATRA